MQIEINMESIVGKACKAMAAAGFMLTVSVGVIFLAISIINAFSQEWNLFWDSIRVVLICLIVFMMISGGIFMGLEVDEEDDG